MIKSGTCYFMSNIQFKLFVFVFTTTIITGFRFIHAAIAAWFFIVMPEVIFYQIAHAIMQVYSGAGGGR